MASTGSDLQARIDAAKQNVAQVSAERSASKARSASASSHSRQSSNASAGERRDSGATPNDGTGGAGTTGMASPSGARDSAQGTGTGKGKAPERIEEEESDEESNQNQTRASSSTATRPQIQRSQPSAPRPNPSTQAQAQTGRSTTTMRTNVPANLNLSEEHAKLLEELIDINGQDSYDALSAGIGKLKKSEYLLLPSGFSFPQVRPADVGKPIAHRSLGVRDWAAIYALNKPRAPEGSDAKVFALLRMEAVKCGWLDTQREVDYAAPPADAMQTLVQDLNELRDRASTIKTASFLVPLVAEHVFRTFGHHFISTDSANYTERYNATFRSCLAPELIGLLPPAVMFHAALHWVSPARSWAVLLAQKETMNLPDALKIRINAAPAGTAILTTTAAILESMAAVGLDTLFARHGGFDINRIKSVTARIKANPPRYHKSYFAYNLPAPPQDEVRAIEDTKEIAIKFAPFAQAYINTYMRDAALGKAQALKKHAEQNPVQLRRAAKLFHGLTRRDVDSVEDLFAIHIGRRSQNQLEDDE